MLEYIVELDAKPYAAIFEVLRPFAKSQHPAARVLEKAIKETPYTLLVALAEDICALPAAERNYVAACLYALAPEAEFDRVLGAIDAGTLPATVDLVEEDRDNVESDTPYILHTRTAKEWRIQATVLRRDINEMENNLLTGQLHRLRAAG